MNLFYVIEIVILFNVSMQIGYKTAAASHGISEFATKGVLPSEKKKKVTNCVMIIISCITFAIVLLSLITNMVW